MLRINSDIYFDIWVGFLRCFVEFGEDSEESRLTFVPTIYPRRRGDNSVLIQKHFRENGKWCETRNITCEEEIALATIVNQAHLCLHRLILAKDQPEHVSPNANYESGTAWDVP